MKSKTNKPYMRKPGDFEIRILKDGKVVMLAPDEALIEIAKIIEPNHYAVATKTEATENGRSKTEQAE
jgi:hypothetical protein